MFQATKYGHTVPVSGCSSSAFTQSLGLIIPRRQCVSGHVVRASFSPGRSSQIRHRNELTAEAWEHAVQGLEKNALSFLFLIYVNTCSRIWSMSYNVMSTFFAAPVGSKMV